MLDLNCQFERGEEGFRLIVGTEAGNTSLPNCSVEAEMIAFAPWNGAAP